MSRGWKIIATLVVLAGVAALVLWKVRDRVAPAFPTPLERAEVEALTSHQEMMAFLDDLHDRAGGFTLETIGASVEGRSLVALHFTGAAAAPTAEEGGEGAAAAAAAAAEAGEKVRVLIYTQQHGDEPSGTEGALALARDIATGAFTDFLANVDLYLVPRVNPDGALVAQRTNARFLDLNRDHLLLSSPEVLALHQLFNRLMPHVTLDVHEYGIAGRAWVETGVHKNFGQQIGALSNPNMSLALREYAWDRVIPDLKERLALSDVALQRYLVGDPSSRFRYSTTALNDGRNSMGIYNTLSFITEGRNGVTVVDDLRERAREQLETMKALLSFVAENAAEVKELVEGERAALSGGRVSRNVALVMDYVRDRATPSVTVGVRNINSGNVEERTFENFYPRVQATVSTRRPLGYTFPAWLSEVVEVLERHGVAMTRIERPIRATMESYRITSILPGEKEDKEFLEVGATVTRGPGMILDGEMVVWCRGLQRNLIAILLEPQSQWGLLPLSDFYSVREVGSVYPIRRIVEVMD